MDSMVDLGKRLTAIGMTMQDLFDLQDAEDRKLLGDRLRRRAGNTKDEARRHTLMEIADALAT
jgi:hypothetical protein